MLFTIILEWLYIYLYLYRYLSPSPLSLIHDGMLLGRHLESPQADWKWDCKHLVFQTIYFNDHPGVHNDLCVDALSHARLPPIGRLVWCLSGSECSKIFTCSQHFWRTENGTRCKWRTCSLNKVRNSLSCKARILETRSDGCDGFVWGGGGVNPYRFWGTFEKKQ